MIMKFENTKPYDVLEGHLKMGETAPNGDSIGANSLHLIKNGKPFMPVMAEIHYSRLPKEEWEDRIIKMKACGINIISSYLFWIKHEQTEGQFNFEGDNDIRYFVSLCKKHGLYCSLRVGPWITAECRNGGLPEWLYLKGIPLRTNDERYLFYVRRWYENVYAQVKDYLFKNDGPVILIQIENEITHAEEHMKTLKEMAIEIGLTAPLFTATGWNRKGGAALPQDEYLPTWGGYVAAPWERDPAKLYPASMFKFSRGGGKSDYREPTEPEDYEVRLPNERYPYLQAEQGSGITTTKKNRPVVTPFDTYAVSIVRLGSGSNLPGFYVFSGGKNAILDGRMTLNWDNLVNRNNNFYPIIHYDFQAPIDVYGNTKDHYRYLKITNNFVRDYGEGLAEMQLKFSEDKFFNDDLNFLRYSMRTKDNKSGYIFVCNHLHNKEMKTFEDVTFELLDGKKIPQNPIIIGPDVAFIMPFGISYGGNLAEYVTAQPVCKTKDTCFFVEIPGVEPVFKFEGEDPIVAKVGKDNGFEFGGTTIVTLTMEEASRLSKYGERIIIGDGADIVLDGDEIKACNFGDFAYFEYENKSFVRYEVKKEMKLATVSYKEIESAVVDPLFFYELQGFCEKGRRALHYFDIEVKGTDGYVYLDYIGDSAQLFVDGKIFDDHFYNGTTWILAAKDLAEKDVKLVVAEFTYDVIIDENPDKPYGIESLKVLDR